MNDKPYDYAALAKLLHSPDLLAQQRMQAEIPMPMGGAAPAPRQGGYAQGQGYGGMREYILSVPNPRAWVRSRIGQIERDRRGTMFKGNPDPVGGTPKVEGKYPFNYELHELRKMLKELP